MPVGYLTPNTLPGTTQCRVLLLPDNEEWIAIITGALEALAEPEAWQKYGTLTPEECAQRAQQMVDDFVLNGACP